MAHPDQSLPAEKVHAAMRFALVSVALVLLYIDFKLCTSIPKFRIILKDLTDGSPLPLATRIVLGGYPALGAVTIVAAIGLFLSMAFRPSARGFYGIGLVILASGGLGVFLWDGLFGALVGVIDQVGK